MQLSSGRATGAIEKMQNEANWGALRHTGREDDGGVECGGDSGADPRLRQRLRQQRLCVQRDRLLVAKTCPHNVMLDGGMTGADATESSAVTMMTA